MEFNNFECVSSVTESVKTGAVIRGQLNKGRIYITQVVEKNGSKHSMDWSSLPLVGNLWVWKLIK